MVEAAAWQQHGRHGWHGSWNKIYLSNLFSVILSVEKEPNQAISLISSSINLATTKYSKRRVAWHEGSGKQGSSTPSMHANAAVRRSSLSIYVSFQAATALYFNKQAPAMLEGKSLIICIF